MLLGIAGNVMKQNAIFPPPTNPEMATEEEEGRCELVVVMNHWCWCWGAGDMRARGVGGQHARTAGCRLPRRCCVAGRGPTYAQQDTGESSAVPRPAQPAAPLHASTHAAGRNFVRGALLGMLATFVGILAFSFPEILYKTCGINLPIPTGVAVSARAAPCGGGGVQACCAVVAPLLAACSARVARAHVAARPPARSLQVSMKVAGAAICNWVMTSYFY